MNSQKTSSLIASTARRSWRERESRSWAQKPHLACVRSLQRADVAKAVASNNDVTIRELLSIVASTSGFERLIAFDETGRVIGANTPLDLLALNRALEGTALSVNLSAILKDNSRSHPQGEEGTYELKLRELSALGLPQRHTIAHTAIEPVFDDFGDLIGALAAIRPLGRTERNSRELHFASQCRRGHHHG